MSISKKNIIVLVTLFSFTLVTSAQNIHEAAWKGDLAKVKMLLKKNPRSINMKDESGMTPLHWAARGEHFEIIKYLINNGADVNVKNNDNVMALQFVIGNKEAVQFLIAKGADVPVKGNTGKNLLHKVALLGYKNLVELMIEKGANTSTKNNNGGTLLHSASAGGLNRVAEMMIRQGADVNKVNNYKLTIPVEGIFRYLLEIKRGSKYN